MNPAPSWKHVVGEVESSTRATRRVILVLTKALDLDGNNIEAVTHEPE